jgi:hypothetical protein
VQRFRSFTSSIGQADSSPFLLLTLLSGTVYLFVFTLPFLLPQLYNTIPPVDYTKLTGYSGRGAFTYVLGITTLFGLYLWILRRTTPGQQQPAWYYFLISGGLFGTTLIFSYPLTAIDVFIYAIRTRGWALFGYQPLKSAPELLPAGDPWIGLAGEWAGAASPYGPIWEWLSLGLFYLSGGSYLGHLLWLKLAGLVFYLGTAIIVVQILRITSPEWATAGLVAFAWNPLVLFESIQNGHNDIVMAFFFMLSLWVFIRFPPTSGRDTGVVLLLGASILVKFVTVLVAPLVLITIAFRYSSWPRRISALLLYTGLVVLQLVIVLWSMWPGWESWAVTAAGGQAGRSLTALFVLGLRPQLGINMAFDTSRGLLLLLFATIYLWQLWGVIRRPAPNRLVAACFSILFWYVLLAAPVFHAWYLIWFLPLAPLLLPQRRELRAGVVFSFTALLIIPYFETVRVWYPLLLTNHFLGHIIGVPLLVVPPALAYIWPIRPNPTSKVSSPVVRPGG